MPAFTKENRLKLSAAKVHSARQAISFAPLAALRAVFAEVVDSGAGFGNPGANPAPDENYCRELNRPEEFAVGLSKGIRMRLTELSLPMCRELLCRHAACDVRGTLSAISAPATSS